MVNITSVVRLKTHQSAQFLGGRDSMADASEPRLCAGETKLSEVP
jgi:hypothetical protein